MCRRRRVRTVDPVQDHFEDDDRRTLHLRLDVRLDCEPIRGCLRATWGAVGTAAAITTSPFGGEEYARRNGFVCTPGTLFRGEDGRNHLCQ